MPTECAAAIWDGIVQTGFAAFAILLLVFAFWLVLQILKLARTTQQVVEANTAAITRQTQMIQAILEDTQQTSNAIDNLRHALEARPCLHLAANDTKPRKPQ